MEIMNGGLVGGKDECMSRDAMEVTTGATRMVMTLTGLEPNGGKVGCLSRDAMEVTTEVTTEVTRMVMTLTGLVPNGGKVGCMSRDAMEVTAGTTRLRAAAPVILAGGS